ncbi:Rho-specific inhibitor of transcription termination (YaeO) [gamma proteobacterium IMCC2047]|nr:Rho-specific inhibitor of transcription termination (YaeO) [gamma proteobacterium IMCC2047]
MISCDLHDYIEIACMYRLPVELELKDGVIQQGTAMDIAKNASGEECLLLADNQDDSSAESRLVVLDQIKTMRALVSNPHFDVVNFLA